MDIPFNFQSILFFTCYGGMTLLATVASLYLLRRRNNAFAADITSPLRLRRWMAATFATVAASHLWWLVIYYGHQDDNALHRAFICSCLDVVFNWSTTFYAMLAMLQDRRRPLWPVAVFVALAMTMLVLNYSLGSQVAWLTIPLSVIMFLYVVVALLVAVRQYGRWLRDNYADLEHKEVWQTYLVASAFLPTIFFYSFREGNITYNILLEFVDIFLIIILLWRVETLQCLEGVAEKTAEDFSDEPADQSVSSSLYSKIETMLQQKCIDTQYYLNHDISLSHLAKHIGTNNSYLSHYFAYKGTTYNTYINNLRIEHFMRLYKTTIKSRQFVTATELAFESGYRSYSTFSLAFKQINGQTAKSWMKEQEKS